MRNGVVVLIVAGLFSGCAETELAKRTRMATSVATGAVVPSEKCEPLDIVAGKFMAGAAVATPEFALREAVTAARYGAAEQGGNFVRLDPLRSWTQNEDGVTWIVAEANGTAYQCPSEGAAPSAQLPQ